MILGHTAEGEPIKMACDFCEGHCGELAFQCINCPGEVTVCVGCMPLLTQEGVHDGTHVFRIIGDYGVGAAPASSDGALAASAIVI